MCNQRTARVYAPKEKRAALEKEAGAPYISVQMGAAIVSIGLLTFLFIVSIADAIN